jgi:hypothetical protein
MFKKSRLYLSAIFASVVLFSVIVSTSVRACEDIPQTLLSLYVNSDYVVLADYVSDGATVKSNEDEYGYSYEIERNLSIVKILKGTEDLRTVTFSSYEYHSNPNQEAAENDAEYEHFQENYFDITKIKVGKQYLFFLTKDKETGKFGVSDYTSGVKDVAGKFEVYEKRLNELKSIIASKENQNERLAEWMISNIEEPETRQDGINDLAESYYSMGYDDEGTAEPAAIVSGEDQSINTSGVAKALTDSQKARISSTLYPMLQEAWFAAQSRYADFAISTILGSINKSRLAIYTFNMMKSVDKSDSARRIIIMEFLINTVSDQKLSDIYYEFVKVDSDLTELTKETSAKAKLQIKMTTQKRNTLLRDFEKRFQFMYQRNFLPEQETGA